MAYEKADLLAGALAPRLALLAVLAEEGNLTRAAQRLGIPQPTATRRLAAIAEDAGTAIVVRAGRGLRFTRAGSHLAESAEAALAALRGGCRHVISEADPERGQVVLAFLHTMGEQRVPTLLRAFCREHPQVRFTLVQGSQEDVLDRVGSGQADLGMTSPVPDSPAFDSAPLDRQPIVVTVPEAHRLAGRKQVRVAELVGEQFAGLKTGYGFRQITDELCQAAGFTPRLTFEGEEVDTVRGLVAAGLAVALLPAAERSLPAGAVEIPVHPPAYRQIGLIWLAGRPPAPAVRTFRDYALSTAR